jgi:apolipoprotein N-acyltransferase
MTYQQLAMSRVRAVEHGRPVLVAATSGVSAIIESNGAVLQQSGIFTDDVLVGDVQLRSDMTLATRIGPVAEIVISLLALGALLVSVTFRVTRAAPPTKMNSN